MRTTRAMAWAEGIGLVLLIAYIVVVTAAYAQAPERVPAHYGFGGVPDAWGGKGILWLLPGVATLIYGLLALVSRFPGMWNLPVKVTPANEPRIHGLMRWMLMSLRIPLIGCFAYMSYVSFRAATLGVAFLWVAVGILAVILAGFIGAIIRASREGAQSK